MQIKLVIKPLFSDTKKIFSLGINGLFNFYGYHEKGKNLLNSKIVFIRGARDFREAIELVRCKDTSFSDLLFRSIKSRSPKKILKELLYIYLTWL